MEKLASQAANDGERSTIGRKRASVSNGRLDSVTVRRITNANSQIHTHALVAHHAIAWRWKVCVLL